VIRPATEEDLAELLAMVRELADFESLSDQCVCTEEDLRAVLFAPGATVYDTVALADDGSIVGHALWFRTFSTFMGKSGIWLEDLYVRPAHRRQGHAGALMADLRSRTEGRVEWEVLEWNEEALDFYQRLGARPMAGWTRYRWTLPQP
jgi:GNAT superfamily N-acetyltransferase